MNKKSLIMICAAWAIVIALAGVFLASYFALKNNVMLGGRFYRRHQEVLDLRERNLTPEEYETLAWQMPDTEIVWSVPFQGGTVLNNVTELTVTQLSYEDIDAVNYLPLLKTVHGEQCHDYPQLLALQAKYPNIKVLYQVQVNGQTLDQDTEALYITSLTAEEVTLLTYLPKLSRVEGDDCRDYSVMEQAKAEHPEWNLAYGIPIAGDLYDCNAKKLTIYGAEYEELSLGLPGMTSLTELNLRNPKASGTELARLRTENPNIQIHWQVDFRQETFNDDAVEIDLSAYPLRNVEEAKEFASKFPNLEKLILESGSVSDDDMAVYRDEVRSDYKVVWTVYFTSKCKARTDETYFMPIQQGEYYFGEAFVYPLRFCEDMVCIDIGHSVVQHVDFLEFMPHLKYLILAHTEVRDITPIKHCKELIYLELDFSTVPSYEPLVECTALEDLNLNKTYCDITPILQMTWLKHLWAPGRSYSVGQALLEALPDTEVRLVDGLVDGQGWRTLKNYYDMRDYLGMYYMD